METLVLWGIGLIAAAGLLFVIELFLPTGGIVGFASFGAGLAGVVAFWMHSTALGVTSLVAYMILVPVAFNFALRVIPNTPVGRMLILGDEPKDTGGAGTERASAEQAQRLLVGEEGRALTDLRPVGSAQIAGEIREVYAEAGIIESGATVRVVSADGMQVKVRQV